MIEKILFLLFVSSIFGIFFVFYNRSKFLEIIKKNTIKEKKEKEKIILENIEKFSSKKNHKEENYLSKKKKVELQREINLSVEKSDYLISKGDLDEAQKTLVSVLINDQNNFEANLRLGKISLEKGNFTQAEIFYSKCIEIEKNSQSGMIFSDLGFCFFKNGKYDNAIESFEYAINLNYQKASNYFNLGQVYFIKGDYQSSLENLVYSLDINSSNIDALFMLGENYIKLKDKQKAILSFERILEIDEENQEAKEKIKKIDLNFFI